MRKLKTISVLILLLCGFSPYSTVYGQFFKGKKSVKPQAEKFGYHLMGTRKSVRMPFKVYSNLIVVQARIDNSDTLNFILDTGVGTILITDPALADSMGLEYVREMVITGAGKDSALLARVSVRHNFKLEGVTAYQQNVVVLDKDILDLSSYMGIPIHGVFGHDFFENYVVDIDYGNLYITVYRPERFKFRRRFGKRFPITVTNSKPFTEVMKIEEESGKEVQLKLLLDTGAGHALFLDASEGGIELPSKVIHANLGRGLNGEVYGSIGRIPKVKMGSIELDDVLASFPDSTTFGDKFTAFDMDRDGSIGGDYLRRFSVLFNYQKGYMALKPIKSRFKEPFEHDMSGLEVRADKDDLQKYYVSTVYPNSPAALAGVIPGDEIMFVNNSSVKTLTLTKIYRILSQKEGKEVRLICKRDGAFYLTEIVLKRVI
ncbi:aspartyl protease family protein [Marinilongibacter aquaticus]|uniref:aspartyl protease family protein n=1 Tax=Marinilongibacter aquaticus TaxID=2975157 RepID=UPI0021BDDA3D|nr:aspartyl protease family protein [Marinilongibacter aquaticus]UBM59037.1 aspartyl protease family protein [Marinilongibacter aquaticus]